MHHISNENFHKTSIILINEREPCIYTFNLYLTNGFSHHYQLGKSTFIFGVLGVMFIFFISFVDKISVCKQNSPRWDAAFCGVTSRTMLFAYVP